MMRVIDYLEPVRITNDAIEGFCEARNRPQPNELCTHAFPRRVIEFRCVYVNKLNRKKYWCRFERANWK